MPAAAPARAVVVTGASTGIGRACALDLAAQGLTVFAGVRKVADGEAVAGDAPADGRIVPLTLDVTDSGQIAAAAETVAAELAGEGRLIGLVNNAGIVAAGPLEALPIDELRRQLEVNVVGQVAVTQAFLPRLRADGGRIVHIGSSSGVFAPPFVGAYAASKFAMEAVADAMRRELRPWSIPVVLVQPGSIRTPIWEKSANYADGILERLSPAMLALYERAIEAVRGEVEKTTERASPVRVVAEAVRHALLSPRPRVRYRVGSGAQLQNALSRFVPDRVVDWAVARALGLGDAGEGGAQ